MLIDVGDRAVEVTSPGKTILPGVTKADLVDYYRRVGPVMLPHVAGRPLTVQRFPDGLDAGGFFQKDTPEHYPAWIERAVLPKRGGVVHHVVVREVATLVYLANLAAVTLHVGLQRVERIDRPDRLVLDLDPPTDGSFDEVRFAARATRDLLAEFGLVARLMATGSKGYHVVVPLAAERSFDEVKPIARRLAELLVERHPDRLTVEQRIAERGGRVFVDWLRNAISQTAVAPYSMRARAGGPIAVPLGWHELGRIDPDGICVANVFRRLGQTEDPWSDDGIVPQSLDAVADV